MAEEITEIIEETTETNEQIDDTVVDNELEEVPEENSEEHQEEEQQEENQEFNPDELDLETDDLYKIGGFDLTKYKDRIDLTNETIRNNFENLAEKLSGKGFNQEQIEFLLDEEFGNLTKEEERTKKDIEKELSEILTVQEKKNYKAIGGYVKDLIKDDPKMQSAYKEIMGNPYIVKLLNKAYTHSLSGKNVNSFKEQKETLPTASLTLEQAQDKLLEALTYGKADKEFIKNLRAETQDKAGLDIILKAINK